MPGTTFGAQPASNPFGAPSVPSTQATSGVFGSPSASGAGRPSSPFTHTANNPFTAQQNGFGAQPPTTSNATSTNRTTSHFGSATTTPLDSFSQPQPAKDNKQPSATFDSPSSNSGMSVPSSIGAFGNNVNGAASFGAGAGSSTTSRPSFNPFNQLKMIPSFTMNPLPPWCLIPQPYQMRVK